MATKNYITVLLVDDDKDDFLLTKKMLDASKRSKFCLEWSKTYDEALKIIKEKSFDVYLIDYSLGIKNGLELLEEVKHYICDKPILFFTVYKSEDLDLKAIEIGATDYIIKGEINERALERSILYSIERKKLENKVKNQEKLKELIFNATNSGMCIINCHTEKITEVNESFIEMFSLEKSEVIGKNFSDVLIIKQYTNTLYNNTLFDYKCTEDKKCSCRDKQNEVRVYAGEEELDCIVSCKKLVFCNGEKTLFRIITFVDISKQKNVEKELIKTQKEMQKMVEEYVIKNKKTKPLMDLVNFEINKFERSQKMAKQFG